GLETAVAVLLTELVHTGRISLLTLAARLSRGPAGVLGLDTGSLTPGSPGDCVLVDAQVYWEVDPARLASRGRNNPFRGRRLQGRVTHTFVGGELVWEAPQGGPRGSVTACRRPSRPRRARWLSVSTRGPPGCPPSSESTPSAA